MRSLLLALLSAGLAVAAPANATTAASGQEPCAEIAAKDAAHRKANNGTEAPLRVPAALALSCLRSVPLDTQGNAAILRAMKVAFSFQSDLAQLKNPPPGALYPASDILGGIDTIESKFKAGYYKNEYDFHYDLNLLARSGYDGHLVYAPDILLTLLFMRETGLVSVSADGIKLPELYLQSDLQTNSSKSPAIPISKINGVDADTWINAVASLEPYGHDPDANYNNVMFSASPAEPNGGSGTFAGFLSPQGNDTVIQYANGRERHLAVMASTRANFDGVTNGASFFQKFCTGKITPSNGTNDEPNVSPTPLVPFQPVPTQSPPQLVTNRTTWFPEPLVFAIDNSVVGYLPEDKPDLAVLQLTTFEPPEASTQEFQNVVRKLLATAYAQGRTRLIVDLRGNGGGYIYLGYDTFRQIFPSIYPYGTAQLRSTPLLRDIVGNVTDYSQNIPSNTTDSQANTGGDTSFNIAGFLDINDKNFSSPQAFYGPYKNYGDEFTALERGNLERASETAPIDVYGFGNNTLPVPQVFAANNIVMLQDGMCASTCTTFSEFMKTQGGVKTIVVGGRPQTGPMQGVGGTKGSQVLYLRDIYRAAYGAFALDPSRAAYAKSNTSLLSNYRKNISREAATLLSDGVALLNRTSLGKKLSINWKNNIRKDDESLTPLQQVYEAADCRFFYTPDMPFNQSRVYDKVYDLQWGNATCVSGSTNQRSSLSGALLCAVGAAPPSGAKYTSKAVSLVPSSSTARPSSTSSSAPARAPSTVASTTGSSGSSTSSSAPTASASNVFKGSAAHVTSSIGISGLATLLAFFLI